MVAAIMVAVGLTSSIATARITDGKAIFQVSDAVYLSLIGFVHPVPMLFGGIVSGIIIDLQAGAPIYLPVTIAVKVLILVTFLFLKKFIKIYFSIIVSYLWVFIYVLYTLILNGPSVAVAEILTDIIQYSCSIIFAIILVVIYKKANLQEAVFSR